uniref:Peptidase aspartic putative domain-containing protein n=1 Tax=Panagrolaimus davidi TaxID=227884 RepID=A0A914QP20_9BILA
MKCSLCDGNHWASNCTKYATPDEKLKQLRSKNYCTKCSRSNHETKNCLSKIACRICSGNHFDYLCKNVRESNKSSAFISVEKRQGNLMTKDITVINPITKETADTVVIFDSGSQQSYVSDRIIQQPKLEKVSKEKINVIGFGAKSSSYMSSLVKLQIKTEEGHKEILANSTKSIAKSVPVLYPKCSDSNDIKTVYKTPEILIGMDYFFDIINSFEKCSDNLFIINSNVGKIFCKKTPKRNKVTVTSLSNTSSPYFDKKQNYLQNTNYAVMNGIQNSSKNKKPHRKYGIRNCFKTLDEKEGKFSSKNGKESIKSETAVKVVNDSNEESAKLQQLQLCGKVKSQKLYDVGLLSNIKLTTYSDVIFDYPVCQPWKPWTSNKIIDQLKLDKVQQEKDQSINKTSNGCGGERLAKNYKKSNKLLNSKKIWYNHGLKEQKDLLKDLESSIKVTGDLNYHHEISNKLTQLNTKITEPFKDRNELLVKLDEVKKENKIIREALNKYVH